WNYPCPRAFSGAVVRILVLCLFCIVPMNTEFTVARAALKRRVWPWLKRGNVSIPTNSLLRILYSRLAIAWLVLRALPDCFSRRRPLLDINQSGRAALLAPNPFGREPDTASLPQTPTRDPQSCARNSAPNLPSSQRASE